MAEDFYTVLGVSKSASADDIKKAYRTAARKYHPDVNPGDKKAEDRFKQANAAFEVLSDPAKRRLYDEFGEDAAKMGYDEKRADQFRAYRAAQQGGGGMPFGGAAGGVDLGDLFGEIFGGARRSGRAPGGAGFGFDVDDVPGAGTVDAAGPARGEDLTARVMLSLADAVRGTERSLSVTRPGQCSTCKGAGTQGPVTTCPTCSGSGRAKGGFGPLQFARTCPTCGGSGRSARPCGGCGGDGRVQLTQRVTVKIPAGVQTGSKVRLAGQGAAGVRGGPAGDLFIETEVQEHPLVRRSGDDLELDLPITVPEAVLGAEVTVPTFTGNVTVKVPPGSQSGRKMRLRGRGVPHLKGGGEGDLYLVLRVMVPADSTNAEVRRAAEALRSAYTTDVRGELEL